MDDTWSKRSYVNGRHAGPEVVNSQSKSFAHHTVVRAALHSLNYQMRNSLSSQDVAREFDVAHSVVSRLWKSFKTTGMCSRRHGEVVLEVRRLQKTDISSYQQKRNRRTTAQQVANQFLAASGKQISRKLLPDV
ncbi:hypothetical protein TNCV_823941 [Trichonephila clavipes]|nr:hypothetical protein TNCV_823941 [Trichonephila clavipes]